MDSLTKNCMIDVINQHLNACNDEQVFFILYTILCHFKEVSKVRSEDERE